MGLRVALYEEEQIYSEVSAERAISWELDELESALQVLLPKLFEIISLVLCTSRDEPSQDSTCVHEMTNSQS